jgi:hypothetical protein
MRECVTHRTSRGIGWRSSFLAFAALSLCSLSANSLGQGTITITFEGPPPQPPGTYSYLSTYAESGMVFVDGPDSLVLVGSGVAGVPDDGTTYLGTAVNTTATVSSLSGVRFGLSSFDVGKFYGLLTPPTLQVVGFRPDGTTITNNFTPSGPNFKTFHFDSQFVGLSSVSMNGGFALDNLVVGIPEPSAGGLILLGTLCGLGWSRVRRACMSV